LKHLK
jgi:Glycoside hydrolase 97.